MMSDAQEPPGAYLTIEGRRWRTSDPQIPPRLRQELVNELMAARRAVGAATRVREERQARSRVQDVKVALGERGRAWWLPRTGDSQRQRIDATIRALLRSRREGASICPSDVARVAGGVAWRTQMDAVRAQAATLARRGTISIWRRGRRVKTDLTSGVLRYRWR